jgi:hypothetical protein
MRGPLAFRIGRGLLMRLTLENTVVRLAQDCDSTRIAMSFGTI